MTEIPIVTREMKGLKLHDQKFKRTVKYSLQIIRSNFQVVLRQHCLVYTSCSFKNYFRNLR